MSLNRSNISAAWRPEFCRGRCTNMSARCFLLYKAPPLVAALTSLRAVEQCSENRLLVLTWAPAERALAHPILAKKGTRVLSLVPSRCQTVRCSTTEGLLFFPAEQLCLCLGLRSCPWVIGSTSWILRGLSPHQVCTMNKGMQCVD